jgi:hypothetical protein
MPAYSCSSSSIVKIMIKGLKQLEKYAQTDPSVIKDIDTIKKSLEIYNKDCSTCKGESNSDAKCLQVALTKLYRQMPFNKHSIYPWSNYEWDYSNFIDNNYSAAATGSTTSGSWSSLYKNMDIFFKLFQAYVTAPNPSKRSKAGGTNKYSDYPIYGCRGNNSKSCKVLHKVKTTNKDGVPYKSKFFNKKLDGEYSSSYFVKVGTCPRPDIKDSDKCIKGGYTWITSPIDTALAKLSGGIPDGSCHQGRYMFINNQPGLKIKTLSVGGIPSINLGTMKGFVPSLANDVLSLTPDKLYNAFTGKNVKGHMILQKCPTIVEPFVNLKQQNYTFMVILAILIILFTVLILTRTID